MGGVTNQELYQTVNDTRREISNRIDTLERTIDSNFVTHAEFEPIKRLVYGAVTAILLAFVAAVTALVYK